jgi:hypothetical protein
VRRRTWDLTIRNATTVPRISIFTYIEFPPSHRQPESQMSLRQRLDYADGIIEYDFLRTMDAPLLRSEC